MVAATAQRDVAPWYRHVWPWLLMGGPFVVVIASTVTFWLAARTPDAMVVDDYYKQGNAINQLIERDDEAVKLGLGAEVRFPGGNGGQLEVDMTSKQPLAWPPAIQVLLVHPTKADLDRTVELHLSTAAQSNGAHYVGQVGPTEHIAYQLTVQDFGNKWRLMSDRRGAARDVVKLRAGSTKDLDATQAAESAAGG
jgi:uncharacterized protein